jgi:hypothetical protein
MIISARRNLLSLLSGIILLQVSCTQESCYEETVPLMVATFYRTGSDEIRTADSVTVYGIGMENSRLYNNTKNVTYLELPLNASTDGCGFVMKINGITDTVRFIYKNYAHLISEECGITFFHTLESYEVTGNRVDTIIFRNSNITTTYEENIRIFY